MAIVANPLIRVFLHNNVKLPDPDPSFEIERVRRHYATLYPELTKADWTIETKTDAEEITFKAQFGTKG